MKIVLFSLLSVLVVGAVATSQPSSGGYGSFAALFPDADIANAEEFLNRIANERRYIRTNLDALKEQNGKLREFLTLASDQIFPHLSNLQKEQSDRLSNARAQIKDVRHTLGPLESQLSGEKVLAKRQEGQLLNTWINIDALVSSNVLLTASLANSEVSLEEAKEKLDEKLNASTIFAEDKIDELDTNTRTTFALVDLRRCFVSTVYVPVDEDTAEGVKGESYADFFNALVPTVYCALEGFVSKVSLGQSHSFSPYGSAPDDFQNVAVSLNCQGSKDHVAVKVFDQSRGDGNAIVGAYVTIKACTFPAQAILP